MRYFKTQKQVREDGTVQYGNLPVHFVIGYEGESEVVFPLEDQVELPDHAELQEISPEEYMQFIDFLREQDRQRRIMEQEEMIKQMQRGRTKNGIRKLLNFLNAGKSR
ncbi:hypothetical protein V6C32_09205 [Desulforamulus ruminis]|uniref:Uncharacterized protein n=1 Tax=Desulforamulus ruminis (strain ATCC 23193 / DSM 2154 / NCIMB 8452 / DL) TaxID=696281 RepID=F6DLP5_DESRL|nr:hypothetical protein [Desulforamulus ruminis]AEG61687.1 hypothetical protein Desru_3484 [Desulforamulus ruminis DSM 2154]